jgi:hypothetical protein
LTANELSTLVKVKKPNAPAVIRPHRVGEAEQALMFYPAFGGA